MGSYFSASERTSQCIPNALPIRDQKSLILSYWTRHSLLETTLPNDIFNTIIDGYAHHRVFDQKFKHALNKNPKQERLNYYEQYDYMFKVVMVGNRCAGMQSIWRVYSTGHNHPSCMAIDLRIKIIEIDNAKCKLQIWRPRSQRSEEFDGRYYGIAHAVLMVYDITNRESFEAIREWNDYVTKYASSNIAKIVIGNKADLDHQRQVSAEEGEELCKELGIELFLETSADTNVNLNAAFESVARAAYDDQKLFELQKNKPFAG